MRKRIIKSTIWLAFLLDPSAATYGTDEPASDALPFGIAVFVFVFELALLGLIGLAVYSLFI